MPMHTKTRLSHAALIAAAALLLAVAVVSGYGYYNTHMVTDCGPECGAPPAP